MPYSASVTISANTLEANPHEETLGICYGVINWVMVLFPPGHAGLTHLQIFYQTRQVFPMTPGESFVGDDTEYSFSAQLSISEVPFELLLRGWNLDDTYDHTIYVEVGVTVPEILAPVVVEGPALPGMGL